MLFLLSWERENLLCRVTDYFTEVLVPVFKMPLLIIVLRASFLWPQTMLSHTTVKTVYNEEPFNKGNNVVWLVHEVMENVWLPIFHLILMNTYFRVLSQLLAPQLILKIWQRCKQLSTWYIWSSQGSRKA